MKNYIITEVNLKQLIKRLKNDGYVHCDRRKAYTRYYIKKGDSVFIYHELNKIHSTKSSKGSRIISDLFGAPNRKRHQRDGEELNAWGFESYVGTGDSGCYEHAETENLFQYAEEIPKNDEHEFSEGAKQKITVNKYERDPRARAECIRLHGHTCKVCGFDFKKVYGELGTEYIHVHHLVPLKDIGEKYKVNPVKDLIPVCPNCHAMLHRLDDPSDAAKLKEILNM